MDRSVAAMLEELFSGLNGKLFGRALKPVPFVVNTRKKFTLRYSPEIGSLVIGGDFAKLGSAEIPGVLLHEMIHVYNAQRAVVDVTANQYHNKYFLTVALDVGLVVIKHKTQGWSITSDIYPRNVVHKEFIKIPSKAAAQRRRAAFAGLKIDRVSHRLGRAGLVELIKTSRPAKTYTLKYTCNCPSPHNSIRSGRRPDSPNALNIMCMNCRSLFKCEEDEK